MLTIVSTLGIALRKFFSMDLDISFKKSIPDFFDEAVYPATKIKIKIKKPHLMSLIILTGKISSRAILRHNIYP